MTTTTPKQETRSDRERLAGSALDVLQDEATLAESKSGLPMFGDRFAEGKPMSIENSAQRPGADWLAIVRKNWTKEFAAWEGKAFGRDVGGTTILTHDEAGLIQSIRLYHRPLKVVLQFSHELGKRLKGKLDPSLFSREEPVLIALNFFLA